MVDKRDLANATTAIQDGVRFELKNVLDSLTMQMLGKEAPIFVECPICFQKASVPIIAKKRLQNSRCRYCRSDLKFKIMPSGAYKVRSEIGLEYVVGTERTLKEDAFKK